MRESCKYGSVRGAGSNPRPYRNRRDFIAGLGAAGALPFAARAQQPDRRRRIGVLFGGSENDTTSPAYLASFTKELGNLGWKEGRNFRSHFRFGEGNFDRMRHHAVELVGLPCDVIVTTTEAPTRTVQQQTRSIPIVFASAGDPVGGGLVTNIARPDGNITGFSSFEPSIAGKWIELLKEAAPRVTRVALLFNPELNTLMSRAEGYSASIEAAAAAFSVRVIRISVRNASEIERALDAFAAEPNGGLIVMPPAPVASNLEAVLRMATKLGLPAIYPGKSVVPAGGLMAFGSDYIDLWRHALAYVDRILRGSKVNDLPVQLPTKFELSINLKSARAIGLEFPPALLVRADEVIE